MSCGGRRWVLALIFATQLGCSSSSTNSANGGGSGAGASGGAGGSVDSGVGASAGSGGAAGAAGTSGFCKSLSVAPAFCADFDSSTVIPFNQTKTGDGGNVVVDTTAFESPPNSLLAATSGATANWAFAREILTTSSTHIVLEVDLKIEAMGPPKAGLLRISIVGANYTNEGRVLMDGGGGLFDESLGDADGGVSYKSHYFNPHLPAGEWAHVRVDLDANNKMATVYLGNSVPIMSTSLDDSWPPPTVKAVWLDVGVFFSDGPGWTVRYDNVVAQLL
jgi:hypothetical protein